MNKIKIMLVDDHAVVRTGMRFLLEDESNLEIVGEASSGKEALQKIPDLMPDVLLLDINMPEMNGIETAQHVHKRYPKVRVLIFSMHNDPDYIVKSIENGVSGYLLKDAEKEEITKAIVAVNAGEKYFPPAVSAILVTALQETTISKVKTKSENKVLSKLSKKEREILRQISEGLSSKDIADVMDLSIRTVSNHRANMLKKTGLNNTAELIRMASNEGF